MEVNLILESRTNVIYTEPFLWGVLRILFWLDDSVDIIQQFHKLLVQHFIIVLCVG